MAYLYYILITLRPRQWVKNFFIFLPLLFSKKIIFYSDDLNALLAFFNFSLFSGAIYLLNDIIDCKNDIYHPKKRTRPIASGKLPLAWAWAAFFLLVIFDFISAYFLSLRAGNFAFIVVVSCYFLMNISYSLKLKKVVILDVIFVAAGFVLRVMAGSAVISVDASHWLLLCAFLISLFLGFCKRRAEITTLNGSANGHREVLTHYNTVFLDQMIVISTSTTVMSYALYTMSPETVKKFNTEGLIFTVPLVLYGIFRYLYIVYKKELGLSPTEAVLTDYPLIACVLSWFVLSGLIIFRN